jgi:hypothetical protein
MSRPSEFPREPRSPGLVPNRRDRTVCRRHALTTDAWRAPVRRACDFAGPHSHFVCRFTGSRFSDTGIARSRDVAADDVQPGVCRGGIR